MAVSILAISIISIRAVNIVLCLITFHAELRVRISGSEQENRIPPLPPKMIRVRLSDLVCVPSPDLGWTSARQSLVIYRADAHGCGTVQKKNLTKVDSN